MSTNRALYSSASLKAANAQPYSAMEGRLDPMLLQALSDMEFDFMTPVQSQVLAGLPSLKSDCLVQAKTGTGKTTAFLLPAIQNTIIEAPRKGQVAVLILSPTRELALQIAAEASRLVSRLRPPFEVHTAFGGTAKASALTRFMHGDPKILVATPGRLNDYLSEQDVRVKFEQMKTLVLDEADRMLDAGFLPDILKVLSALPSKMDGQWQGMCFSATLPPKIQQVLSNVLKRDRVSISTIDASEPPTLEKVPQYSVVIPAVEDTFPALFSLIKEEMKSTGTDSKIIVFGTTANLVALYAQVFEAQTHLTVYELQSRLSQPARTKATDAFKATRSGLLFATDVIGRGMDFPDVTLVIQVGLPMDADSYTHRVGRTARAGKDGRAVLLLTQAESFFLKTNRQFPISPYPASDRILNDVSSRNQIFSVLQAIEPKSKQKAYSAYLGYMKGPIKKMQMDAPGLVRMANAFALGGMQCSEVPGMEKRTIGKMGLKGVPGIRIVAPSQNEHPSMKRGPPLQDHAADRDGPSRRHRHQGAPDPISTITTSSEFGDRGGGGPGRGDQGNIRQLHPQLRRSFITSRPLLDGPSSDEPKVRWYEQLLPWSTKRRRVDPNNRDPDLNDEAKWLKRQISQLEDELREMEAPAGKTLIEPLIATLSPEDQQKVRAAIMKDELEEKRKDLEVAQMNRKLAKLVPQRNETEIHWQLPPEQGIHLRTLNTTIQKVAGNLTDQDLRKKLWKSYTRCKTILPPFLHLISEKAWTVLWASHHTMPMGHPQWASRLVTLAEDMLSTGRELDKYQKILYIEGLRHDGRQEEAISQWQKLKGDLGEDTRAIEEYELLGVRMFASNGDPEKAEKIALNYLRPEKSDDSRILIPILSAWAERGDAIGIKHAWALYLRFKAQIGANMTMEDYDNITISLMNAGRAELALAVFKDLMLTGEKSAHGSIELYEKAASLIGKSQSSAITPEDLNRMSLTGLIALPKRFQNRFFYGSWLKKLLGMGEVDAAGTVVELMYERGVRPDSKHLNGIVGAWLRTGSDQDREAAEKMAWAMIYERLDLVRRRGHGDALSTSDMPSVEGINVPPHLRRTVSPANIETFSVLLQHYGRRGQDENVQLMQQCLAMAQIPPNSYFINHLLYVDLRKGQPQLAWERYERTFRETRPDLETFACLWDCEKAHLDSLLIRSKESFPEPRRLMSEMMNWYSLLQPGEREPVREDFSNELHNQIIRCFGQAADLEGVIAALYAMKESFGIYPDEEAVRTIRLQVGRMGIGEDRKPRAGRIRKGNPQRKANAARIAQAFAIMTEQREKYLVENGLNDMQQCDVDIQKEEELFVLAEFMRAVLRTTTMDEDAVQGNIEKAAWEMGVSGVPMEDPFPSYNVQNGSHPSIIPH